MSRALLLFGLAACGDNLAPVVDAPITCGDAACRAPCTAVFAGNFAETSASLDACPMLMPGAGASEGHTMLDFLVPAQAIHASLGVRIDLGPAPTIGGYASATTRIWEAIAIESVPVHGACVFIAGARYVPSGSFHMQLDALELAHGAIHVEMSVLPNTTETGMQSDCGAGTTESLDLMF